MRHRQLLLAVAAAAVCLCVATEAHASTVSNLASVGSGAAGLGDMLGTFIDWAKSRIQQIVIFACLGAGLALLFAKNFLHFAETLAYVAVVGCFLAWVASGGAVPSALGAVIP